MTEKAKHTAGNWISKRGAWQNKRDPMFWHCNVVKGGIRIAKVTGRSKEEAEANAHLIAATPETKKQRDELLATLKALVNRVDRNGGLGEYKGGPIFVMNKARELITEAEKP